MMASISGLFPATFCIDKVHEPQDLTRSTYEFLCLGRQDEVLHDIHGLPNSPMKVVLESRILCSLGRVPDAVALTIHALKDAQAIDVGPLTDLVLMMKPEYALPLIEGRHIRVGAKKLKEVASQGLTLKEGVLFERLVKPHDRKQVVAYRIHSLTGRGEVLRQFGFEVGDEIYSVDGRPVTSLGFGDALAITAKLGEGSVLRLMVRRQGESDLTELHFMFESSASLALAHHAARGREDVH